MKSKIFFFIFLIIFVDCQKLSNSLFEDIIKFILPVRLITPRSTKNNQCECGLNNFRSARVINGSEAIPNSQPWVAALYSTQIKKQFCSATLINSKWLITAFHCLVEQTPQTIQVLLGVHQLNKIFFIDPENNFNESRKSFNKFDFKMMNTIQSFKAKRFIFNHKFEQSYFKNDIALIELEDEVKFNNYIRPICLISEKNFIQKPSNLSNYLNELAVERQDDDFLLEENWLKNQELYTYGWGRTSSKTNSGSEKLKVLSFKYEYLKECRNKWLMKIPLYGSLIDENHLCVTNPLGTICNGDSGSPLITKISSLKNSKNFTDNSHKIKHYLLGVASAGYYCKNTIPPLYTRITKQLNFIYSNVDSGYWCSK